MADARRAFNLDFVNGGDVSLTNGLLDRLSENSQMFNN